MEGVCIQVFDENPEDGGGMRDSCRIPCSRAPDGSGSIIVDNMEKVDSFDIILRIERYVRDYLSILKTTGCRYFTHIEEMEVLVAISRIYRIFNFV